MVFSATDDGWGFRLGDDRQGTEWFGDFFFTTTRVPADELASALHATQPGGERFLHATLFRLAIDEQCVGVVHLFVGHVVAVVPQNGFVGLDSAECSVGY